METKRHAVICDLDGTLANINHRRQFVEGVAKKDWKSFFAGIPYDEINLNVLNFLKYRKMRGDAILIVTGRPGDHLEATLNWLGKWETPYESLWSRAAGDFRSDCLVKKEIYEEAIKPSFDVRLVLDDRDSVVKMWRSLGLECWQVAEGAF